MNTPEERWWSVRAGEYVLGTLRGEDLRLFRQILAHDTSMQVEVAQWEQRLAGLDTTTPAQAPGDHVWPHILEQIDRLERSAGESGATAGATRADDAVITAKKPDTPGVTPIRSTRVRPSALWPTVAGLATAASLVLGVLLLQRINAPTATPLRVDGLAVVVSDDTGTPYFLVETDYGNLRVRVTTLSPPSLDDERDFQLWQALPDRSAVRPVALLPETSGASRVFEVNSLIDGSDLFGVSIEPVGASTEAGPTGPVVAHGDFLPTRKLD